MSLKWTSGTAFLVAAPCTFLVVVVVYAVRQFRRSKQTLGKSDQERLPVSCYQLDHDLPRSLYADPVLDATNPRNHAPSVMLSTSQYAIPPLSRPRSLYSSKRSIKYVREADNAIYNDEDITDRTRSRSLPRIAGGEPDLRHSYRPFGEYHPEPAISEIGADRRRSRSKSRPRSSSHSTHRDSAYRASMDMASVHTRRSSVSALELRQYLHLDAGPVHARPEDSGFSPFLGYTRTSSSSRLPTMISQSQMPHFSGERTVRGCSRPSLEEPGADITFADLRAIPVGSEFSPRSSRRKQPIAWDPDVPPVPPLPLNYMIPQVFPRNMV